MNPFFVSPYLVAEDGFVAAKLALEVFDVDLSVSRNYVVRMDEIRLQARVGRFSLVRRFFDRRFCCGFLSLRINLSQEKSRGDVINADEAEGVSLGMNSSGR